MMPLAARMIDLGTSRAKKVGRRVNRGAVGTSQQDEPKQWSEVLLDS
jgi:hypothetical protein